MLKQNNLKNYWYLFRTFFLLGSVSFGGYLALVGMVRDKLVLRDKVMSDNRITEALALGSLLPGPLAVNVTAYLTYSISGFLGALISVIALLLPSYLIVLFLTLLYFEFNSAVNVDFILMGIIPVVVAIVFSMSLSMWKESCTNSLKRTIAVLSCLLLILVPGYATIVAALAIAGITGVIFFKKADTPSKPLILKGYTNYAILILMVFVVYFLARNYMPNNINFILFENFATASLTLFGGGYVMIPVLKVLLVDQLSWVSPREFFLGISLGQVTPGPILISSVFFGYKVNGVIGSIVSCISIFFPSSMLMILASKFYSQINRSVTIESALMGIKPAVVGLIIYSGFTLVLVNPLFTQIGYLVLLTTVAFLLLYKFKVKPMQAVVLGASLGYLFHLCFN